ncbi:MAG: aryl-sulfate sulfotransferase [Myxococcales bacterium]|nr:aryl-sulfate sulfotransferase [Myxococcales bacterium]
MRLKNVSLNVLVAMAVLALVACGDDDKPTPSVTADTTTADGDASVEADSDMGTGEVDMDDNEVTTDTSVDQQTDFQVSGDADAGGDTEPPEITNLAITLNPMNGLSAWVELDTDEDAWVSVVATEDVEDEPHIVTTPLFGPATSHEIDLLGLRSDRTYNIEVFAYDAADNEASATDTLDTDELPEACTLNANATPCMPPITLQVHDADKVAPGFTLFNASSRNLENAFSMLFVIDNSGEIIWYYYEETELGISDARITHDGYLLFARDDEAIRMMDWMGEIVGDYYATAWTEDDWSDATDPILVDADTFHHEAFEMPNGNILALSTEIQFINNAVPEGGGWNCPGEDWVDGRWVVGDVAVEFTRTGSVERRWSTFDFWDPCRRVTHDFAGNFWNNFYGTEEITDTDDWTHGNAVIYDEDRDVIIFSFRHSDAVVAVDYDYGEELTAEDVAWVLGENTNGDFDDYNHLDAVGETRYQYHQHAPMVMESGNVILFDNGNERPGTDVNSEDPADWPFSRAVEFEIDTTDESSDNWTAEEVFSYSAEWYEFAATGSVEAFTTLEYAPFVGDADELSNGNILIGNQGLAQILDPEEDPLPGPTPGSGRISAHALEVTHTATPEVVWELYIQDMVDTDYRSFNGYRLERIEGFYNVE